VPTITDVAQRAGVGVGTVSRVVNRKGYVDPGTRARVETAIAELGWIPQHAARNIKSGRGRAVAVVVPYLTTPSIPERLHGVEAALEAADLDMIATSIERPGRRAEVLKRVVQRGRIDGLLLVSIVPDEEELDAIRAAGIPLVLIDAYHRSLPRVIIDDAEGGELATRHVLELGHRRVGFVGDRPVPGFRFTSSRLRLSGVNRALREQGLAIPEPHVGLGSPTRADARELATAILTSPHRPTALVVTSDIQALGVLEAARSLGLRVPEDLSVVGFDDLEVADFAGLTTIRQPLALTGQRGVERLLDLIAGREAGPLREVLPVELVVRTTTGPPPLATAA
jgi:DNA-binding LacI/PurR family transcriptional regulator